MVFQIFDVGKYVSLCKDEDDDWHVIVTAEEGISKDDPNRFLH